MSNSERKKRHDPKRLLKEERRAVLKSSLRYQRGCPDKFRIVGNTVVGLTVDRAALILKFGVTRASRIIGRCLSAAIDRAAKTSPYDVDDLYVKTVRVDRGPMLKRMHMVSHGMAKPILKRLCHVTVVVDAMDPNDKRRKKI
ncbi:MAG: 50S ribosomal protein L22 [Deltaproteobacteria bacterium]|nr:50S ribosomal protein L22 [Deltaproteobacteria bacterium]